MQPKKPTRPPNVLETYESEAECVFAKQVWDHSEARRRKERRARQLEIVVNITLAGSVLYALAAMLGLV